jgi:hypothetical protein
MCKHNNLKAVEPVVTGVECNMKLGDNFPDYFMYRQYICLDCGKIVTVLHAVIHN